MVNYVLSFCKITGASRIFSRNFYLPLLKPLTPKEALRTFRITGRWLLGSKIQHYIPVLLNHKKKRSRRLRSYGKKRHNPNNGYTYMSPVFDPENESHKMLLDIIKNRKDSNEAFVYTVDDRQYNIVLDKELETAIRKGEIIDVLVSQKNDKIILKLKNFKKVPVEIQYFDEDGKNLMCGEGATAPEEEKFHHHGKYTMSLAKIFEDKEMVEEKWEEELRKMMRKRRRQAKEGSKEWRAMLQESIKNLDWEKFEEDAKKVIDEIEEPAVEENIGMEIDNLEATKNVNETIMKGGHELLNTLPTMTEIPEIIKNMGNATLHEIEKEETDDTNLSEGAKNKLRVSGVKVKLPSGKECFVSGQMVHTEEGDVFVPGQTIENEYGLEYVPGITINVDNKPTLINGLIMGEEEREPMFLPTQSAITADGQLTFATAPEERPTPAPEKVKKASSPEPISEIIIEDQIEDDDDEDQEEDSEKSIELTNSEMEEIDIEAMRLKQEQQRLELEKLRLILTEDGMDDLVLSLEEKKLKLQQKLDELRRLSISLEDTLISYITDEDAMVYAAKISTDPEIINRISDILITIIRRAATFRDRNSINADNVDHPYIPVTNTTETDVRFKNASNKITVLLKSSMVAANDVFKSRPRDQLTALNAVGEMFVEILKNDEKMLEDLLELMNTPHERNEICNSIFRQLTQNLTDTKVTTLRKIASRQLSEYDVLDCLEKILDKDNDLTFKAFSKVIKVEPELLALFIDNINNNLDKVQTEEDTLTIVENAIIASINLQSEKSLTKMIEENRSYILDEFKLEAEHFAKALGLDDTASELYNLNWTTNLSEYDNEVLAVLKRMIVIKRLADRDYSLKTAIARIRKNVECAKTDPRIRQLIRESAVLISNKQNLKNSREIPLQLVKNQNLLAIEDFLMQHMKISDPVLVNRNTYQAVVPKEAARGVLAGRVPYVLVDESGVTHFKPMHMFSAVSVNKNREKRIEDYLNGKEEGLDNTKNNVRRSFDDGRQVA